MTSTRHHNIYTDGAVCFWTSSIIDHIPVFRSPTACRRALEVLDRCRRQCEVKLLGYVLMPEHAHLAAWSQTAEVERLFIRQFLMKSAHEIVHLASSAAERGDPTAEVWLARFRDRARQNARVRVWKERGRAFPVTRGDGLRQKLDYIHNNPVRRELVQTPEE